MIRHSAIVLLEIVGGLMVFVVLALMVAVWRLSAGPINVDFLTPYLEDALTDPETERRVTIEESVITWAGWSRTLDLRARDVRVIDAEGFAVMRLPETALSLSLGAMLRGVVAPTRIEAFGARVSMVREPGGTFDITGLTGRENGQITDDLADAAAPRSLAVDILKDLLAEPSPERPIAYLDQVFLTDARVIINDRVLEQVWDIPVSRLALRGTERGLDGEIDFTLAIGETKTTAAGSLFYARGADAFDFAANFTALDPPSLALAFELPEEVGGVMMPLNGSVKLDVGLDGRIRQAGFLAQSAGGVLDLEGLLPTHAITAFRAEGEYLGSAKKLTLQDLRLVFAPKAVDRDAGAEETGNEAEAGDLVPGPEIRASGEAAWTNGGFTAAADVVVEGMALSRLEEFWPAGMAAGGRAWMLENMPVGTASKVTLSAGLEAPADDPTDLSLEAFAGTIEFSGAEAHYLRPMPPVTGIDGIATFDIKGLYIIPSAGSLGPLSLTDARVDLLGLDGSDHRIDIDFSMQGPLRAALEVVDHPRLNLLERLGLEPDQASGETLVHTRVAFPLIAALDMDDITVSAEAVMSDTSLKNAALGLDLTGGELTLAVDKAGMTLSGPGTIGGVPLTFAWQEQFAAGPDGIISRIEANVPELDDRARETLGFEDSDYVAGPIALDLLYIARADGGGTVDIDADVEDARLGLPFIDWSKEVGEPGGATARVVLQDGEVKALERLRIRGANFDVQGVAEFDGGALARAELARLHIGETDLSEVSVAPQDDGLVIRARGGRLDARPFLSELEEGDSGERTDTGEEAGEATPLVVDSSRLDSVITGDGREVREVELHLERQTDGWHYLEVRGRVPPELARGPGAKGAGPSPGPVPFSFFYGPDELAPPPGPGGASAQAFPGGQRLQAETTDFGAVLRAFDLMDSIVGGQLSLTGGRPAGATDAPIMARIQTEDFRLVEAPVMARLLTLGSLTGFADTLSGKGIGFRQMIGDLTIGEGRISTDLLRAYGPAMGLTAEGNVDFAGDRINVRGTIVPSYTINSVIGKIPLLGDILVGGEGEGVIAFTYTLSGTLQKPEASVNPLSALAPGFLRGFFKIFSGGSGGETGDGQGEDDGEASAVPPVVSAP